MVRLSEHSYVIYSCNLNEISRDFLNDMLKYEGKTFFFGNFTHNRLVVHKDNCAMSPKLSCIINQRSLSIFQMNFSMLVACPRLFNE